tara:strand:- start:1124 stop:1426 length:303 start_codon:yes stop_codon:yes gene_type:complete
MIVIDTNTFNGVIAILPRYYDELTVLGLVVTITNEDTRNVLVNTVSSVQKLDGFLSFSNSATFANNVTYKIKIVDTVYGVIFRGKIFATTQSSQNYRING